MQELSCDEIGEHKKNAKSKAMLPVSEDMLMEARLRLWTKKGWGWGDIDDKMTYLGLMWGFDKVARVRVYRTAIIVRESLCTGVAAVIRNRSHGRGAAESGSGGRTCTGCQRQPRSQNRSLRGRSVFAQRGCAQREEVDREKE